MQTNTQNTRTVLGFLIKPSPYTNFKPRRRNAAQVDATQPPVEIDAEALVKSGRKVKYPFAFLQPGEGFYVPFAASGGSPNSVAVAALSFEKHHTGSTWDLRVVKTINNGVFVTRVR